MKLNEDIINLLSDCNTAILQPEIFPQEEKFTILLNNLSEKLPLVLPNWFEAQMQAGIILGIYTTFKDYPIAEDEHQERVILMAKLLSDYRMKEVWEEFSFHESMGITLIPRVIFTYKRWRMCSKSSYAKSKAELKKFKKGVSKTLTSLLKIGNEDIYRSLIHFIEHFQNSETSNLLKSDIQLIKNWIVSVNAQDSTERLIEEQMQLELYLQNYEDFGKYSPDFVKILVYINNNYTEEHLLKYIESKNQSLQRYDQYAERRHLIKEIAKYVSENCNRPPAYDLVLKIVQVIRDDCEDLELSHIWHVMND